MNFSSFLLLLCMMTFLSSKTEKQMLEPSEYVTIVMTVPETHANQVREAMGKAGAGRVGNYSHCSFSVKGIGRFKPEEGARPFLGKEGEMETVVEERIETVCRTDYLERVLEAIKKAHPYEETVIDIYPVYQIGRKTRK
jgi:hypothetical protein